MEKQYTLIMTYQYTAFDTTYEKTKAIDFDSDDLNELVDILTKYVNGFLSKEKKRDCWMYFRADIRNNALLTYDTEYIVYEVSLERKD